MLVGEGKEVGNEQEGRRVRLRTAVDDFGVVVDLDEVGLLDHGKGHAEGVHPEGRWVDL